MREIIVTVDDGGMHPAVNAALERCIPTGNVHRVSVMATGETCSEAVAVTMAGGLKLAAHLDCCRGPFLLSGSDFPDSFGKWLRASEELAGKVRAEWAAQIEKILAAGGLITAMDSHRHLHHIPALSRVIISLAEEYGIHSVRSAVLPDRLMRFPSGIKLDSMGKAFREKLLSAGLYTTDRMLGFGRSGKVSEKYLRKYSGACEEGSTELVMHPAVEPVWSRGQTGELELIMSDWFGEWCAEKI